VIFEPPATLIPVPKLFIMHLLTVTLLRLAMSIPNSPAPGPVPFKVVLLHVTAISDAFTLIPAGMLNVPGQNTVEFVIFSAFIGGLIEASLSLQSTIPH